MSVGEMSLRPVGPGSGAGSLLDEHIDPDYQPTEKEVPGASGCGKLWPFFSGQVEEYAEWLGMDAWR